jgi:hypothetical protein
MATYSVPKGTFNHATLSPIDSKSYMTHKNHEQSRKRYRVWVCSNSRSIAAEVAGTYRAMGRKGLVM